MHLHHRFSVSRYQEMQEQLINTRHGLTRVTVITGHKKRKRRRNASVYVNTHLFTGDPYEWKEWQRREGTKLKTTEKGKRERGVSGRCWSIVWRRYSRVWDSPTRVARSNFSTCLLGYWLCFVYIRSVDIGRLKKSALGFNSSSQEALQLNFKFNFLLFLVLFSLQTFIRTKLKTKIVF